MAVPTVPYPPRMRMVAGTKGSSFFSGGGGGAAKVAVLFKELRAKLDRLLADKIKQPDLDLWEDGRPVVDAILQLLETERVEVSKESKAGNRGK